MAVVIQRYESQQFTGTNGAEIAAWLGNMTYGHTAEDGTLHMTMDDHGTPHPFALASGWWVLRAGGRLEGHMSPESYALWYYELPGT